jgi:quinol monooxygenase YgiN
MGGPARVFIRAIRFRWLPGQAEHAPRLTADLVRSARGRAGCRAVRVLQGLDGDEGLVVFEWEGREQLEAHAREARLETVAPWVIALLHWRTDQLYEGGEPGPDP